MSMASRQQQQQQRRVVGTQSSRIDASSLHQDENPMNYYSVIGLRTWGQNYYDTVVKNSLASVSNTHSETVVQATPSPQKKSIELRVSIPQEVSSIEQKNEVMSPDDACKTPGHAGTMSEEGQPLPSTVSKHLNGMFDDIMKQVFLEDGHGQGEAPQEDEGFRIAACPSPTREARSFRQPITEERQRDEVVLNMEDMSPLLERMREIDRARNGNIALPLSTQAPTVADEAVDLEIQQTVTSTRKHVPSLVHFFDAHASQASTDEKREQEMAAKRAPVHGRPPLPSPHSFVKSLEEYLVASRYSKKLEHIMLKHVLPVMHRTTHGKRMIFAMIALAYLVAIHVYIITSKL